MEAGLNAKDEGISDVLHLLKNVEITNNTNQNNEVQLNGQTPENDTNVVENQVQLQDTQQNEKSSHNQNQTQNESNLGQENMQLDLSNPDQVLQLLETVDLNEEDTETLLQEAYNMNRKLKEMLRRQQHENDPSKSHSKSDKKKTKQNSTSSGNSATSSATASRMGSASLRKSVLPPIEKEGTSVYAVKLQRSRTNVVDVRAVPKHDAEVRSKSSLKESHGQPRKSKVKSTEPKAEWNNRFNYT